MTALFADISGFTSLAETLDTEELHEVVTPLVNGLTGIAERYGGFVEKFAGDALLAVFGVPTTHSDDPQRSLLAALEMHGRLPELLAPLGPRAAHLGIHVGVNTGRVIGRQVGTAEQSDYAVLGDSVILAQRLEAACPSGETYVGAATRDLCSDEFHFEPLPPLSVKGKSLPVRAHRLLGRRTLHAEGAADLVGRSSELAWIEGELECPGALLAVRGDAGAGKTRLVTAAAARATGPPWWRARCLSYGASLPYWPFTDLLRRELGVAPGEPAAARAAVARLTDDVRAGLLLLLAVEEAPAGPQAARRAVHDAVTAWFGQQLAAEPRVLLVEDVHWIDPASADLLREVVVRVPQLRVVMTGRPDPAPPVQLPPSRRRELDLDGLDATGVADLAAAVLGAPPGPMLTGLLLDRTGGNPLFVQQLARALGESGALVVAGGCHELRPGAALEQIPTTVEQVLATRVDRLPPAAAGLLQVAAVIGRRADLRLLQAVADREALTQLPVLLAADMLVAAEDAVQFHHALLQDVVRARLLRRRSRELHQRVADAARELFGDGDETVGLVARHLYLAGAGPAAVDALRRAGRRAAAVYANDEAAQHLSHAVEVVRELGVAPPDLLRELAAVEELRGGYDAALELYREARRDVDDVAAWQGEMRVLRARGRYDEALALHEQSRLRAPELELERAATLINAGRHREAARVLEAVVAGGDDGPPAALVHLARAYKLDARLEEALRTAEAAVARAAGAADPREEGRAQRVLGDVLVSLHRLDEAETAWSRALALARSTSTLDEEAGLLLNLGYLELERQDLLAALRHNEQAVTAFERVGHGSGTAIGYGNLAWTVLQLGRPQECLELCARATEQASAIGHLGTLADVAKTRALALIGMERVQAGRAAAREAASFFEQLGDAAERDACLRLAQAGAADQ